MTRTRAVTPVRFEVWRHGQLVDTVERELGPARERLVLGSDPACDVVLAGDGVAPQHATLRDDRYGVVVRSYAGQPLVSDGRALAAMQSEAVWSGDVIELGDVRVIIDTDAADAALPVRREREGRRRRRGERARPGELTPSATLASLLLVRGEPQAIEDAVLRSAEPTLVATALAHRLASQIAPSKELARALCRAAARDATLYSLLPRLAALPGWSRVAAHAFGDVPADVRDELAPTLLGHPFWSVRLWAALALADLADRECALRAVRRSFVASDFSPPMFTVADRPSTRIPVARGPELPRLPNREEALHADCADLVASLTGGAVPAAPGPLVLAPADREHVEAAARAARERAFARTTRPESSEPN